MSLGHYDDDNVIGYLMGLPEWEFERAVRRGQIALVTRMLGFPRGYFVREVRRMKRNLDAFTTGVAAGFKEQQERSIWS